MRLLGTPEAVTGRGFSLCDSRGSAVCQMPIVYTSGPRPVREQTSDVLSPPNCGNCYDSYKNNTVT